jgi:hypothetical protein
LSALAAGAGRHGDQDGSEQCAIHFH